MLLFAVGVVDLAFDPSSSSVGTRKCFNPRPFPSSGEGAAQHHAHLHLHGGQHHAPGRLLQLPGHQQDGADGHPRPDQGECGVRAHDRVSPTRLGRASAEASGLVEGF